MDDTAHTGDRIDPSQQYKGDKILPAPKSVND
jgi:hypothetical protein